jgi:hypothetical protein
MKADEASFQEDEEAASRARSESLASISSQIIHRPDRSTVICGFRLSPAAKTFIAPLILFATITAAQVSITKLKKKKIIVYSLACSVSTLFLDSHAFFLFFFFVLSTLRQLVLCWPTHLHYFLIVSACFLTH